jgi:hypothetical protein
MPMLGERFCSCALALATVILASSLVGEAKAQSLPDQQGHRDEDHPEVIVAVGSVPMAAWVRLLEQGGDGIAGSGWGGVHNPRLV